MRFFILIDNKTNSILISFQTRTGIKMKNIKETKHFYLYISLHEISFYRQVSYDNNVLYLIILNQLIV